MPRKMEKLNALNVCFDISFVEHSPAQRQRIIAEFDEFQIVSVIHCEKVDIERSKSRGTPELFFKEKKNFLNLTFKT